MVVLVLDSILKLQVWDWMDHMELKVELKFDLNPFFKPPAFFFLSGCPSTSLFTKINTPQLHMSLVAKSVATTL